MTPFGVEGLDHWREIVRGSTVTAMKFWGASGAVCVCVRLCVCAFVRV